MTLRSGLCFFALPAVLAFSGCAPAGDFPSLMPRPAERAAATADPEPSPSPGPAVAAVDPSLAVQLNRLVSEAEQGQSTFEKELAAARPVIARAGGLESESWIEAQLALSRLETLRTPTVGAAAEVDKLAVERTRPASVPAAGDIAAIEAAAERIEAIALGQRNELARLGEQLSRD